jgi:hypothetical protein
VGFGLRGTSEELAKFRNAARTGFWPQSCCASHKAHKDHKEELDEIQFGMFFAPRTLFSITQRRKAAKKTLVLARNTVGVVLCELYALCEICFSRTLRTLVRIT